MASVIPVRCSTNWGSRVRIPLKAWFFQASSFQLLKLENSLWWSLFTFMYNRRANMNYFIYTSYYKTCCCEDVHNTLNVCVWDPMNTAVSFNITLYFHKKNNKTKQETYKTILVSKQQRNGLMVGTLDSEVSGSGLSPGRGHCVVFLGKTYYSYSAWLHPSV